MDLSSSKKWRCDPLGVLSVASLYESDAGVEREPQADHRKEVIADLFFCFLNAQDSILSTLSGLTVT